MICANVALEGNVPPVTLSIKLDKTHSESRQAYRRLEKALFPLIQEGISLREGWNWG